MTLTQNKRRLKYWLLLAIFGVSTVIGSMPVTVNADTTGSGTEYFSNRADKWYSARYLRDCMNTGRPWKISLLEDGSFFAESGKSPFGTSDDQGVDIGRYYKPTTDNFPVFASVSGAWEGWIDCYGLNPTNSSPGGSSGGGFDNSQIMRAINDLGFSTPREFLIGVGYSIETPETICTHKAQASCTSEVTVTPYAVNEYRTIENNLNKLINSAEMRRTKADEFFVYDAIFSDFCTISRTITGNGDKATFVEIVQASSGEYVAQNVDVEFPTTSSSSVTGTSGQRSTSTTKEADKEIKTYDYGGNGAEKTKNITCKDLLAARNERAPAMVEHNNNNKDNAVASNPEQTEAGGDPVCTGGSLGWILCPLTDMAGDMIESLAGMIEQRLIYKPLLGSSQGDAIQGIWRIVVGIANILLVIAFMVVIFSQATSVGLSAYGIKKMLPRIIAAAILINLSFFICALAVDISNVLGASVQGIIESVRLTSTETQAAGWNGWFVLLATALVAGTVVTGAIFYIFPFLLTAALTLLMAFILLAVREIMITLLIIVAPLAFAAFVLPNTDSLYKKWQKLFMILLLMYPLIMLIFYGSTLMSRLIMETKTGEDDWFVDIIAFIMLFVPLFILPTLLKMTGGIMEKIGAWANNKEKGLIDGTKKWASQKHDNSTVSQIRAAKRNATNTNAQRRAYTRMGKEGSLWQGYTHAFQGANTRQLLETQVDEANSKIHAQRVAYAKQNMTGASYNVQDERVRADLAREAAQYARSGDRVKLDALLSRVADTGADELQDVYTQLQGHLGSDAGSDIMKQSTKYISSNYGETLGAKSRGLMTALENGPVDSNGQAVDLGAAVRGEGEYAGIKNYYKAMNAETIAKFSTNAAEAAAPHLNEAALRAVIENENLRGVAAKKGTYKAYYNAYVERFGAPPEGTPRPEPDSAPPSQDTLPGV